MNCPLCIDQSLEPNHRGGIEIDVCPKCRGIWLDRGEIDRLTPVVSSAPAPSVAGVGPAPSPDPAPGGSAGTNRKKKRKSLGERLGEVLEEALDL